jgi:hypothetical protein
MDQKSIPTAEKSGSTVELSETESYMLAKMLQRVEPKGDGEKMVLRNVNKELDR